MATTQAYSSLYRGFSTAVHREKNGKTFSTIDIETIKRDLLNHIYTIPGERVMYPNFGTRIPLMAFEPLDPDSIKIIEDDLKKVFDYDPRVRLIALAVFGQPDNNAIIALADLEFIELGIAETMQLEFATDT